MKRLALGSVLLLFGFTACSDLVGLDGDCTREKMTVRLTQGSPRNESGPHTSDRNHVEYWEYDDHVVVFRWGVSYESCEVSEEPLASFLQDMMRL